MRPTSARSNGGYTYLEILVALLVFSVALVPATEAIQAALRAVRQDTRPAADGTERTVTDGQAVINKMESLLAKDTATLAASPSGRSTSHETLSDAANAAPRCLVYTAWYKPEAEQENDRYVETKTNLLWIKVSVEGSGVSATTLVLVP